MAKTKIIIGNEYISRGGTVAIPQKHLGCGKYEVLINNITRTITAGALNRGAFRDRNSPSVFGIGYIGYGEFTASKDGDPTPEYVKWSLMLMRVADTETYNCTVSEDWKNFQKFSAWYVSQKGYGIRGMELDKQLLPLALNSEVGREYSETNCCILPYEINSKIVGKKKDNGLPQGVHRTTSGKYTAYNLKENGSRFLGTFKTIEEAAHAYNLNKADVLSRLTDKWSHILEHSVTKALEQYIVFLEGQYVANASFGIPTSLR